MTIADFVQQVYYAIYKVRLDVAYAAELPEAFHANTDKFKEVLFEANFVLQELQQSQDWTFLREKLVLDRTKNGCAIQEFEMPDFVYKVATGFNDAVRLRHPLTHRVVCEIPFTQARSGNANVTAMFDEHGDLNVHDNRMRAFLVGRTLTFDRPWNQNELGLEIETDIIRRFEPLHICGPECTQPCTRAYLERIFEEIPDPYYMVLRTAAKRAEGDPSAADRVESLAADAQKSLSAMRSNDSAHNVPDTYKTSELGFVSVV